MLNGVCYSICIKSLGFSKKPLSCGSPGQVANSVRTVTGQSVGQTVTFKCNPGYRMSGSSIRRCLQVGRWSHSLPTCKRKYLLQLGFQNVTFWPKCDCMLYNNPQIIDSGT